MIKVIFEGAEGDLRLEGGGILNSGIEIVVKHSKRRNQRLQMMSGGEKTLVGIALLFTLLFFGKYINEITLQRFTKEESVDFL
ncbi:MAG: hypothetical protein J7K51_05800 [Thermotogae bacterium]|nr:hypothetical protein [Thermotogota bacterium]